MRVFRLLLGLCVPLSLAFAQLDSNSVTVTSTRTANLQADQAVFAVSVSSGVNKSLTDIVSAVQSLGITTANFTGLNSFGFVPGIQSPTLTWQFSLAVPISKLTDTASALVALQKSIGQNNSGLSLSFNVQGTQISQETVQAQTCSFTDLLADARAKAQSLATAAGLKVGAILAMSSNVATSSGAFTTVLGIASVIPTPVPNCTVTVKFALGS